MFLQNIFEPDICARKSKVFRLYLHIAPRPFASSQSRRNKGDRGAIPPPSDFGWDRSKTFSFKRPWITICPSPQRIFISSYGPASMVATGHITVNYTEECHSEQGHFKTYFQGQRN